MTIEQKEVAKKQMMYLTLASVRVEEILEEIFKISSEEEIKALANEGIHLLRGGYI